MPEGKNTIELVQLILVDDGNPLSVRFVLLCDFFNTEIPPWIFPNIYFFLISNGFLQILDNYLHSESWLQFGPQSWGFTYFCEKSVL